jgi:hypothetical protein
MNKLIIVFLFNFVVFISCEDKKITYTWDGNLSVEENIANNMTGIRTNEQFFFLRELVKTRDVIILGEYGHYDPLLAEVKSKMVVNLKNSGVNTVALEAASFLTSYVFSNPEYLNITKNWKIEDFWSMAGGYKEGIKALTDIINRREIKIWGIDPSAYHCGPYDIISLKAILSKYLKEFPLNIDWDYLEWTYMKKFRHYDIKSRKPVFDEILHINEQFKLIPVDEQFQLMRIIASISNYVRYVICKKGETLDLKVVLQWIRNVRSGFPIVEIRDTVVNRLLSLSHRLRDGQMAENIEWITENFPKEKLIVWCANFHGMKDVSQTIYPNDSLAYLRHQTMGETLYNTFGNRLYTLAIYRDISRNISERHQNAGKLELEISKRLTSDMAGVFIDFESLRFADGYRDKEFECAAIMKKQGRWTHIYDGIYYICE